MNHDLYWLTLEKRRFNWKGEEIGGPYYPSLRRGDLHKAGIDFTLTDFAYDLEEIMDNQTWCGCEDGDMDNSYPWAKLAAIGEIIRLLAKKEVNKDARH